MSTCRHSLGTLGLRKRTEVWSSLAQNPKNPKQIRTVVFFVFVGMLGLRKRTDVWSSVAAQNPKYLNKYEQLCFCICLDVGPQDFFQKHFGPRPPPKRLLGLTWGARRRWSAVYSGILSVFKTQRGMWCQKCRLGPPLLRTPGARMTVVTQTPSNNQMRLYKNGPGCNRENGKRSSLRNVVCTNRPNKL